MVVRNASFTVVGCSFQNASVLILVTAPSYNDNSNPPDPLWGTGTGRGVVDGKPSGEGVYEARNHVHVIDSESIGYTVCRNSSCLAGNEFKIDGHFASVAFARGSFTQTKVTLSLTEASAQSRVTFSGVHFSNDLNSKPIIGGIFISIAPSRGGGHGSTGGGGISISVEDSLLENQLNWSPVDAVMNIFHAAILVRLLDDDGRGGSGSSGGGVNVLHDVIVPNVTCNIARVTFLNNDRALTLQGERLVRLTVEDCLFRGNAVVHAGWLIY